MEMQDKSENTATLSGTSVVPGVVLAPTIWMQPNPEFSMGGARIPEADREAELDKLRAAINTVADRLQERSLKSSGPSAEVLKTTAALVKDRGWTKPAERSVADGTPAVEAVVDAIAKFIGMFEKVGGLMAERTTDLKDIRARVAAELLGLPEPGVPTPTVPSILCADDLSPADTAELDPKMIVGILTRLGGPTSHTAIIARQLAIPCMVAVRNLKDLKPGTMIFLDSSEGIIKTNPDEKTAQEKVEKFQQLQKKIKSWTGPAGTKDGHKFDLLANVQDGKAAATAAANSPITGIGLFRTELCFLDSNTEPTVEEQIKIYQPVFEAVKGKVVVRTLDAGSDKPLAFANHAVEENPALGVRGLRIGLRDEGMLTRQLDAIGQAARNARGEDFVPQVMAPMVARISEAERFAELARERKLSPGIMVEIPSVALLAPKFLEVVDFFSIGTNDLAQYTMAADRLSPNLAALTDPWQPALLRLIKMAAEAGIAADKYVGVCGEAAAHPLLARVLVGLGVTSLSMAYTAAAEVGLSVSEVDYAACQQAADIAINATGARDAKKKVSEFFAKNS